MGVNFTPPNLMKIQIDPTESLAQPSERSMSATITAPAWHGQLFAWKNIRSLAKIVIVISDYGWTLTQAIRIEEHHARLFTAFKRA